MDQHFLTPLFSPRSIVVFAGDPKQPEAAMPIARALLAELTQNGFKGEVNFLDIEMTGTLSDLAQSRADLAIIALPHEQIEPALEIAGRIRCRAALVLSSNLPAAQCAALHTVAKRHGLQLLEIGRASCRERV